MSRPPLTFEPLFMERVWGGRRLAERFGKPLPQGAVIGESWELVDRPEAQSVVRTGEFAGMTLGELWRSDRREALFGAGTARGRAAGTGAGTGADTSTGTTEDRFPLLIKLLDCEQTLSVQVHPPATVARALNAEPKTEMWIILDAAPGAQLFTGLRVGVSRQQFEAELAAGADVSELLGRHDVQIGDAMFLPSGRIHAIGAGNVILEVQQNSDTTYRVFDFNRPGLDGQARPLHIEESIRSIDWDDFDPPLVVPEGETLVHNELFEVDRLTVSANQSRPAAPDRRCAALMAIDGPVNCGGGHFAAGELFLLTADADADGRRIEATHDKTVTVLRTILPASGG